MPTYLKGEKGARYQLGRTLGSGVSCKVKLAKDSEYANTLTVNHGERIAQGMIIPIPKVAFVETAMLSSTERGEGGFGSTGKH